jgi:CRP/FNR family transcriptional regulator/CRP/FNR family cyclic AMP-dependent transcriptional regulator
MDPVPVLARTPLFNGFPREELEPLAPAVKPRTFARGSYVFHEGDPGNALFIIQSGQVKISRMGHGGEEAVFVILLAGDSFGEMSLFGERAVRSADAQAMELTECLTLAREPFVAFLERHPALMQHMIVVLSGYIRRLDDTFTEAAFLDIPGRVAKKLLDLAEQHGEKTPEGIRIGMRLSQRTLAGMVAASRENVNRALARFLAHGDIQHEGGFITIRRPAELRKRS